MQAIEILDEKCWPGYQKKGMKTMFGKRVPNCVKKETVNNGGFSFIEDLAPKGPEVTIGNYTTTHFLCVVVLLTQQKNMQKNLEWKV